MYIFFFKKNWGHYKFQIKKKHTTHNRKYDFLNYSTGTNLVHKQQVDQGEQGENKEKTGEIDSPKTQQTRQTKLHWSSFQLNGKQKKKRKKEKKNTTRSTYDY